jgi:hypothetical protein
MSDVIDKPYWLSQGFQLVDGTYKRVVADITSLGTFLNGLLSGYVLLSLFVTYSQELDSLLEYTILISPLVIASLGKFYTFSVVMPDHLVKLWPESWESCKRAMDAYIVRASVQLRRAKVLAWVGAITMVAAQVLLAFLAQNVELEKAENRMRRKLGAYSLAEVYNKKDTLLTIHGLFPDTTMVTFEVDSSTVCKHMASLRSDSTGMLVASFKLNKPDTGAIGYRVTFKTPSGDTRTMWRKYRRK